LLYFIRYINNNGKLFYHKTVASQTPDSLFLIILIELLETLKLEILALPKRVDNNLL
jgi:hypothetical protein